LYPRGLDSWPRPWIAPPEHVLPKRADEGKAAAALTLLSMTEMNQKNKSNPQNTESFVPDLFADFG
jgi:hypothetical protein